MYMYFRVDVDSYFIFSMKYHKLYNCCALILYRIFCMPLQRTGILFICEVPKKLHHVYQQVQFIFLCVFIIFLRYSLPIMSSCWQYDHEVCQVRIKIALPLGPGVFVRSQASYLFILGTSHFKNKKMFGSSMWHWAWLVDPIWWRLASSSTK
jgi:hypothetical protein